MNTMNQKAIAGLAGWALLLSTAASAQTSFTANGWPNGLLTPGITCTNALGQAFLRSQVHTARVQGSDARVTGQVLISTDGYNTNGIATLQGTAYLQVGAWDPVGTNFTPTAGMWEMNWHGVMQADCSLLLNLAGYGSGGTIDGLRIEQTLTRTTAVGLYDPAVPYLCNGTIRPAPVTTIVGLNNWLPPGANDGTVTTTLADGQLTISGSFPVPTTNSTDTCAWDGVAYPWSAQAGKTLEARVDLARLGEDASGVILALFHANSQGYGFSKSSNWVGFWKQHSPGDTCLYAEAVTTKNTNVVLVLALMPAGQHLILTGKVVDKDSGTVLYETNIVDTPASDPSLGPAALAQITGLRAWPDIGPDPAGVPWLNGIAAFLLVFQDTDGNRPPAEATFANLELRTYEVPQVGIARAVQLSWPAPAGVNYGVEGAPTTQGPWLRIQDLELPGVQHTTVPLSRSAQFFRLVQAP